MRDFMSKVRFLASARTLRAARAPAARVVRAVTLEPVKACGSDWKVRHGEGRNQPPHFLPKRRVRYRWTRVCGLEDGTRRVGGAHEYRAIPRHSLATHSREAPLGSRAGRVFRARRSEGARRESAPVEKRPKSIRDGAGHRDVPCARREGKPA
jgi:hypothetical protein